MNERENMDPVDPKKAALLVIDMQNGFCDPHGGLSKAGVDVSAMTSVVPNVRRLVETCRELGLPIMWSLQQHLLEDTTQKTRRVPSHIQKRKVTPPTPRGSWDAELVPSLKEVAAATDYYIVKHRFSMFYSTTLESLLRMLGVTHLIVCGVATNVCVESTVRDAYFRDFDITVIDDCVAGTMMDLHEATLKNVQIYLGELVSLDEFVESHRERVSSSS
jgi:ureidoacrylate peracid hydrolase